MYHRLFLAPLGGDDGAVPRASGRDVVTRADPLTVEAAVWAALAEVRDPEIPPVSITDMGIVGRVRIAGEVVEVELLPTFAGCPALDVIREDAERAARAAAGDREVRVRC